MYVYIYVYIYIYIYIYMFLEHSQPSQYVLHVILGGQDVVGVVERSDCPESYHSKNLVA